jgi:branched-chain amino acid transport system ATP-binding protein
VADILACDDVTKRYGGLVAVSQLSFAVEQGEIFAIVGPNGAGKTTLFDSISGISPATSGVIRFDGHEIQSLRPHRICQLGVVRTFQTTTVFGTQTVLANALVGSIFGQHGASAATIGFSDAAIEAALDALEFCTLLDKQAALAAPLSVFEKKRLMLATALATRPKLLLLDEPVGGLTRIEREGMIELVRKINRSGVSVLLIEHVMKAVQALANRMLVLHHGEKIAEGPPAEVLRDEKVVAVYLGKQHELAGQDGVREERAC